MALLQEIKVPLLAVNDTTLTVVDIAFASEQKVNKGDILLVFETSKTTYEVVAEAEGYVQYFCEAEKDYEVNQIVAKVFDSVTEFEKIKNETKAVEAKLFSTPSVDNVNINNWQGETFFSQKAANLIASSGINKALFNGKDFVSKADVEEIMGINQKPLQKTNNAAPITAKNKPVITVDNNKVTLEKLTTNKKREIDYLSEVQLSGLTSTINTSIDTGGIFVQVNDSFTYLKNSLLPLLIYETGRLLKKYPLLNAYFAGDTIATYKEVNMGFAIDIEKGLKVVKIPLTNEKNLAQIESDIMSLSDKYLDDKLEINDLIDISFTITDLSAEGVTFFKPLVNMMNSAILGVSAIDEQLNRCILSLTFDHRVTEGKYVAQFLKELKQRIQTYKADEVYKTKEITCFKCYTPLAEDLSDVGYVACVQPNGQDGYICQRCFKGF